MTMKRSSMPLQGSVKPSGQRRVDPIDPSDIEPVEGKTEVWVGGRLVGELQDPNDKTGKPTFTGQDLIAEPMTQAEVDAEKVRAETVSKQIASKASQSKKEVARMAR